MMIFEKEFKTYDLSMGKGVNMRKKVLVLCMGLLIVFSAVALNYSDVDIAATNIKSVYIGDPYSTIWSEETPVMYRNRSSITQTIYLDSEISHQGMITQIKYMVDLVGDVPPDDFVKFYIAKTDKSIHTFYRCLGSRN